MTALDNTDTAELVTRLHAVTAEIAELTSIADDLKQLLRSRLHAGTYTMNGDDVIAIRPNRRFNIDAGVALLPEQLREACRADGYDPKKVKEYLAPALLEQCMIEVGQPKVVLL